MTTAMGTHSVLPYGVGRTGFGFFALVGGLLILVALGIVAYGYQVVEGEVVTGLRDVGTMGGAAWGLYIVFDVYFVGVSFAGVTLAAIIRLFNLTPLRPVARMAMLLTVVSLILGALTVLVDVGRPLEAIMNLLQYARPQSPFFGTLTLVLSGCLFASLVYFYLDGRRDAAVLARRPSRLQPFFRLWAASYADTPDERERHSRATFWLALAIILLLVAATSTSGFIFGIQGGSAGWFSALQAPAFVLWAGLSGVGHIIVLAALARWRFHLQAELPVRLFVWLGNLLGVLIVVALYFVVAEMLTAGYAAQLYETRITQALLTGDYAWMFWTTMGLLVVSLVLIFGQFVSSRYRLALLIVPAVLVNLAAIGKRYLIVVPSQTHGGLLPYETGTYAPTLVEYAVVMGLMAFGALLIVIFLKVFPIMQVPQAREEA